MHAQHWKVDSEGRGLSEWDRGAERTGTSLLSFMSPGCVSGPFVVLFGIPQQTTNRPHKAERHQVTGESRCVCLSVCMCVRRSLFQWDMFMHPFVPHPTALSPCTAWSGFMDALWASAWLVHFACHPVLTAHRSSAAHSENISHHAESGQSGRVGRRGYMQRKTKEENCPVEKLKTRKHRISFRSFNSSGSCSVCGCIVGPPVSLLLPSSLIGVMFHQAASTGASVDACVWWMCVWSRCHLTGERLA